MHFFLMLLVLLLPFSAICEEQSVKTLPTQDQVYPNTYSDDVLAPYNEPIPSTEGRNFMWEFVNMLVTLAVVVALLIGMMWFLRRLMNNRLQQMNTSSEIKIVESRALSSKASIHLLDIHGKSLVIAESPTGVTFLCQLGSTPDEEIAIAPKRQP